MSKGTLKLFFSYYSPPARGAYLAAKALNLDVDLKEVNILSKDYLIADLVKVNPQHTIPTLQDEDFVVWDSHAISGYLVGKYGSDDALYPKDPQRRAIVDQRLYFDTESLFPKVFDIVIPILFRGQTSIPNSLRMGVNRSYMFLELFLKNHAWLAGENLTIADLCCVASISTLDYLIPVLKQEHPKLTKFLESCKELPYYEEANQTGLDMLGSKIQERLVYNRKYANRK